MLSCQISMITIQKFKKILRWTWALLVLFGLLFYFSNQELFTAESLQASLSDNSTLILTCYILISCLRAFLFLPSTIFVLMGMALYPNNPIFVLTISLIGILIGSTLVYYSAYRLAPESLFKGRSVARMENLRSKLDKYGFSIVLLWSFFPIVPTDLICFISGMMRMHFLKFIAALFLGELILVSLYVWTGGAIFAFFS